MNIAVNLAEDPADGAFACSIEISGSRPPDAMTNELQAALDALEAPHRAGPVQLWLPAVAEGEDELVAALGFAPYRDLWQLRVDLPLAPAEREIPTTRGFAPGDADAFLAVNNRAFAWHPEQGGMTADDLAERQAEPWFDADMFRIHERDGRIAGFNWLKVHDPATGGDFDPPMGEIYVIAVDPDFHGLGLGSGLSRAGLAHLHTSGITRAMLYVESDNDAANRVYERLGFGHHQTNRAYRRDPAGPNPE